MVGPFREAGSVERKVTNVWSVVQPESSGKYESLAILDCTAAPGSFKATPTSSDEWLVQVPGYTLGPPPACFKVYDGMIKEMHLRQSPGGPVELVVQLEHPVDARVTVQEGVPARLRVHFTWGAVHEVMTGRTILLDPGHGGKDRGARGPINLWEKNVTLEVARSAANSIRRLGADVMFTRTRDQDVTASDRFDPARVNRADCLISLHTGYQRDRKVRGSRTLFWPPAGDSRLLARCVQEAMVQKVPAPGRGIARQSDLPPNRSGIPAVTLEMVCISNPVEEAFLRNTAFHEEMADAIARGVKNFFLSKSSGTDRAQTPPRFRPIPIQTHILSDRDDIVEVVQNYTRGVAEPGDIIAVAESPVAITQGRAVLPQALKPGMLARLLSKLPNKDGSLGTPPAMQMALREAGTARILLGVLAGGLGRLIGRRGDFFRVAGRNLAQIDDIGGTLPPYDGYIVPGPEDPAAVAAAIKTATGIDAMVADVNDMKCVDILGITGDWDQKYLIDVLRDNPFGNEGQRTPIVILKAIQGGHPRRQGQ